ncbi:hypothetical protein [Paraburkholderia terrae]|uniref:DUF3077 domain-containing protein n=1 Tax=Paraburkholderia terrae TaxID=311230 RepID=A0ABM7U073_9BURK|nr:hypothetical protein [Paraburkholderia terrae]BCZ84430.1 hypothetical protein PTKU64_81050 [Paraburkholderia terrae]BDC45682.1 hypothetical protein PTKU15_89790 [Paraburkholderia terrae]
MSSSVIAQEYGETRYECIPNVASEGTATLKASKLSDDAILSIARRAGMLVMLDGRIGRETYHSVTGSLSSLHRFVADLHDLMSDRSAQ